ncbi:MAG: ribonuclease H-like domain-containing protein [Butyrivibrio sp.]|nr:ribonuclease H-like domain-containing protein [Butyrivibrio sp.]
MTKYTEILPDEAVLKSGYPLDRLAKSDTDILFLDIETTGLSPKRSGIYLIGCACREGAHFVLYQWFADHPNDETVILTEFLQFARRFRLIVTFNGERFDLPFIDARCTFCKLPNPLSQIPSLDIYRNITPWRSFLGLPDCKQRTVELFLGLDRQDRFSGKQLIETYKRFLSGSESGGRHDLLLHNAEDVRGLFFLMRMLHFEDLFRQVTSYFDTVGSASLLPLHTDAAPVPDMPAPPLSATRVQADTYQVSPDETRIELIIHGHLPESLPSSAGVNTDTCSVRLDGDTFSIRMTILETELKYFYANYRDYYYLPAEDEAMHKSISSYVDRSHRVQANASNCYTRKKSRFLQQWSLCFAPFFKSDYQDRRMYFELTEPLKVNRQSMSLYATHILAHLLSCHNA